VATTVTQAFREFRQSLEITNLQTSTVSTRQQNVRDAIAAEMAVLETFLTGSYRRHTLIAPLKQADIDVFVVLDPKYFEQNGQAPLLDRVRRILLKTYTKSLQTSRNGQAVTITFTDFVVDVVPGFNRQGGGYLIPDPIQSRWIATDPTRHVDIWADANKAHDGDLVPLLKMLKAWNRAHSALLRSFHLETLALSILKNVNISDFPSGTPYVFDKARETVKYQLLDPAGYDGSIGGYLDTSTKVNDVVTRLQAAYDRALQAESFDKQGYPRSAIEKWQVIFGEYFPTYG